MFSLFAATGSSQTLFRLAPLSLKRLQQLTNSDAESVRQQQHSANLRVLSLALYIYASINLAYGIYYCLEGLSYGSEPSFTYGRELLSHALIFLVMPAGLRILCDIRKNTRVSKFTREPAVKNKDADSERD